MVKDDRHPARTRQRSELWTAQLVRLTLCLAIAISLANPASARTWRVIKDGSGDFTTIVDAMAAIADGDTVEIHPGRYPGFRQISLPGQSGPASCFVTKNDITIRGTDREAVIIGPETPNWSGFWPKGIVAKPGTTGLRIESLTLENLREGGYLVGQVAIDNAVFRGNRFGIVSFAEAGLQISHSVFETNVEGLNAAFGTSSLLVTESSFTDLGTGIYLQAVPSLLDHVEFACGGIGVYAVQGAEVVMTSCTADGTDATYGVAVELGSTLTMRECVLDKGMIAIGVGSQVSVTGSQNVLSHTTLTGLFVDFPITFDFHSNDILPDSGHAFRFWGTDRPPITIDVRNNYWGVDTAQEVEDLIWHAPDGEPGVTGTALYEPFALRTVPTRMMSFSELRAIFGGRR